MAVNEYDGANVKTVLTFENGTVYQAETYNLNDNTLKHFSMSTNVNNTTSNPLGIPFSARLTLKIIDNQDTLVPTNRNSPHYGYMKEGVKIEMFRLKGSEWLPFGVFYSDGWTTDIAYNSGYLTCITARDILTHLGMLEVPKLSAFSSIKAIDVIKLLFEGCGFDSSQYEIDQGLKLDIPYFVTKGKLMKDTLKELCQALIGIIVSDNTGRVVIKPAFQNSGNSLGSVDIGLLKSLQIRENKDKLYDAVKVIYSSMSVGVSRELASIPGHTLAAGDDYIDNIEMPSNTIGIDCVSFEYGINSEDLELLNDAYYQGFQGGLSVQTVTSSELITDITVRGRTANDSSAYVYDSEHPEGTNNVRTLSISNIYIQNKKSAQEYADNVLKYLRQLEQKISINAFFDLDVECGKTFTINNTNAPMMNGTYYITSVNLEGGDTYSCTLEAIKLN